MARQTFKCQSSSHFLCYLPDWKSNKISTLGTYCIQQVLGNTCGLWSLQWRRYITPGFSPEMWFIWVISHIFGNPVCHLKILWWTITAFYNLLSQKNKKHVSETDMVIGVYTVHLVGYYSIRLHVSASYSFWYLIINTNHAWILIMNMHVE